MTFGNFCCVRLNAALKIARGADGALLNVEGFDILDENTMIVFVVFNSTETFTDNFVSYWIILPIHQIYGHETERNIISGHRTNTKQNVCC